MKKTINLFILTFIIFNSYSEDIKPTIKEMLQSHGVTISKDIIIVGVSKNDCKYHVIDLGKVCNYLQNKKVNNVIFLTDNINNFHEYIYNKFSIKLDSNIRHIDDSKLYNEFYSVPLSFCSLLSSDKNKMGSIGTFFNYIDIVSETYQLGIINKIDITYLEDFSPWSFAFGIDKLIMSDYSTQHTVIMDYDSGSVLSAMLSRSINIDDSIKRELCKSKEDFILSSEMKKAGKYRLMGLNEFTVSGIDIDSNLIHLYLEYSYFSIINRDTTIKKQHLIGLFNSKLQFVDWVKLQFDETVAHKHFAALMMNGQILTENNLYTYNMTSSSKARQKGFSKFIREKNNVLGENMKLYYLSKKISRKDAKGHLDLTCRFDNDNNQVYAYHIHYPIVYLFGQDEPVEIVLETEAYKNQKKMRRPSSIYINRIKKVKYGRYFSHVKLSDIHTIAYHNSFGKKIGAFQINKEINISDIPEGDIIDSFWTYIYDKQNKRRYALQVVSW